MKLIPNLLCVAAVAQVSTVVAAPYYECAKNGCKDVDFSFAKETYDKVASSIIWVSLYAAGELVPWLSAARLAHQKVVDIFNPIDNPFDKLKEEILRVVDHRIDLSEIREDFEDMGNLVNDAWANLKQYGEYREDSTKSIASAVKQLEYAHVYCESYHNILVNDGRSEKISAVLGLVNEYCLVCNTVFALWRSEVPNEAAATDGQRTTLLDCTIKAPSLVKYAIAERMSKVPSRVSISAVSSSVCFPFSFTGRWTYRAVDGETEIIHWKERGLCISTGFFIGHQFKCRGMEEEANRCIPPYRQRVLAQVTKFYEQNVILPALRWKGADPTMAYPAMIEIDRSGYCIDAPRRGVPLHSWPCTHGNSNQEWLVKYNNEIALVNYPDYCIDVAAGSTATNAPLQTYKCQSTPHPNMLFDVANNKISWKSNPNYVVDLKNNRRARGNPIVINRANGGASQRWRPTTRFMKVLIQIDNSEFCLDSPSRNNGDNVHLWECSSTNKNQHWLVDRETGEIMLADGSEMVLGGLFIGYPVQIWKRRAGGHPNQRFNIKEGQIEFRRNTAVVIDLRGNGRFNGNVIHTWQRNNTPAQRWNFVYL